MKANACQACSLNFVDKLLNPKVWAQSMKYKLYSISAQVDEFG